MSTTSTTEVVLRMTEFANDILGVSKRELTDILSLLQDVFARGVPGDVVELGCAQGVTTTYLRKLMDANLTDRTLHVFDSFKGLPRKRTEDGTSPDFLEGSFAMGDSVLIENFRSRGLKLPVIHRGWFGEIEDYPDTIAFAFLDGDFYDSIMDSLAAVWPRLSEGAAVVIHDFNRGDLPGVALAVSVFSENHPIEMRRASDHGVFYFIK